MELISADLADAYMHFGVHPAELPPREAGERSHHAPEDMGGHGEPQVVEIGDRQAQLDCGDNSTLSLGGVHPLRGDHERDVAPGAEARRAASREDTRDKSGLIPVKRMRLAREWLLKMLERQEVWKARKVPLVDEAPKFAVTTDVSLVCHPSQRRSADWLDLTHQLQTKSLHWREGGLAMSDAVNCRGANPICVWQWKRKTWRRWIWNWISLMPFWLQGH